MDLIGRPMSYLFETGILTEYLLQPFYQMTTKEGKLRIVMLCRHEIQSQSSSSAKMHVVKFEKDMFIWFFIDVTPLETLSKEISIKFGDFPNEGSYLNPPFSSLSSFAENSGCYSLNPTIFRITPFGIIQEIFPLHGSADLSLLNTPFMRYVHPDDLRLVCQTLNGVVKRRSNSLNDRNCVTVPCRWRTERNSHRTCESSGGRDNLHGTKEVISDENGTFEYTQIYFTCLLEYDPLVSADAAQPIIIIRPSTSTLSFTRLPPSISESVGNSMKTLNSPPPPKNLWIEFSRFVETCSGSFITVRHRTSQFMSEARMYIREYLCHLELSFAISLKDAASDLSQIQAACKSLLKSFLKNPISSNVLVNDSIAQSSPSHTPLTSPLLLPRSPPPSPFLHISLSLSSVDKPSMSPIQVKQRKESSARLQQYPAVNTAYNYIGWTMESIRRLPLINKVVVMIGLGQ
ncbi:hypothetical protein BKA69DRAFT_1034709 [Paraphysoderma sedebokerense]|nr:hypothetical protein BKA69DRAFT_1034709 [Paraphysoderma sedebokerense]